MGTVGDVDFGAELTRVVTDALGGVPPRFRRRVKVLERRLLPVVRPVHGRMYDQCWVWTRPYGFIDRPGGRVKVHVWVYECLFGVSVGLGQHVVQLCHDRRCCRPTHLKLTAACEAQVPVSTEPKQRSDATHCKRGHLLQGENVSVTNDGRPRRCRTCARERQAARYRRLRQSATCTRCGNAPISDESGHLCWRCWARDRCGRRSARLRKKISCDSA